MSAIPQGKAIQAMYRDYIQGNLLVNRKYQRKLVWALEEKRSLVDSILKGYPIPLILLAERPEVHGPNKYEIIDGIQRLNAIFTFIEQAFDLNDRYFDVGQFATAAQHSASGGFTRRENVTLLDPESSARVLDYQLAVTVYPAEQDSQITDVFGRVNSGGRQLSAHERRQAGVTSQFSTLVRSVAAELRGDVSQDVLTLSQMPEISIESGREPHGYGIRAEDTLWCRQGILSIKQLRESEDEQMIADVAASILLQSPLASSKEKLDALYDLDADTGRDIEARLISYGGERLRTEIKDTFALIKEVVQGCSADRNFLRSTVRPGEGGSYPIKAPFYALFMAFHSLGVVEQKSPTNPRAIMEALRDMASRIQTGTHYETTENRVRNIDLTKGLIQQHFAAPAQGVFRHGPSLSLDFENALRRSSIESSRYEFKQGLLQLSDRRERDRDLLRKLLETACGIANAGPETDGNLFLGVADNERDADRVRQLDGVVPRRIGNQFVVGIDREAQMLHVSVDEYVRQLVAVFQQSNLTEPLKSDVLRSFDTFSYQGLTVVRIRIPSQRELAFLGDKTFCREGSSTVELIGPRIAAATRRFAHRVS